MFLALNLSSAISSILLLPLLLQTTIVYENYSVHKKLLTLAVEEENLELYSIKKENFQTRLHF